MTKSVRLTGIAKSFFICVGLSLVLAGAARAEPLVIGYSSVTSVFLPFWIGKEAGFYKKEKSRRAARLHRQLDDHGPGNVCAPGGDFHSK